MLREDSASFCTQQHHIYRSEQAAARMQPSSAFADVQKLQKEKLWVQLQEVCEEQACENNSREAFITMDSSTGRE